MMQSAVAILLPMESLLGDVLVAATIDRGVFRTGRGGICDSLNPAGRRQHSLDQELLRVTIASRAAIIAEPTLLQPVHRDKGLVRWKIETIGKQPCRKAASRCHAIEHRLPSPAIPARHRRCGKRIRCLVRRLQHRCGFRGGVK